MTKPTSITEAYALWLKHHRAAHATTEPSEMERHLAEAFDLELLAVKFPAMTVQDVWDLLRMTTDGPDDALNVSHGLLIARAHVESAKVVGRA